MIHLSLSLYVNDQLRQFAGADKMIWPPREILSRALADCREPYDLVIDGTDNFPTRYLTNDACVLLGKPNVYGSIFRFEGQASVFFAEEGPCYRCLFPEPPPPGLVPSCAEGGVLGVLPGTIGAIQATETIKLIIGQGESLIGRLLLYDALGMTFDEVRLRKNPNCPVCGSNPTVTELIDYEQFCGMPAHDRSMYVTVDDNGTEVPQITPLALKSRLDEGDAFQIVDVREAHEWEISNLADLGAILVPQNEILDHMGELDMTREIVIMCRSGVRSAARPIYSNVTAGLYPADTGDVMDLLARQVTQYAQIARETPDQDLEAALEAKGDAARLEAIRRPERMATVHAVQIRGSSVAPRLFGRWQVICLSASGRVNHRR